MEALEDRTVPIAAGSFTMTTLHDTLVGTSVADHVTGVVGTPTYSVQTWPTNGYFTLDPTTGAAGWLPTAFAGTVSCEYVVTDSTGSASGTITLVSTNIAPVATGGSLSVGHNQVLSGIDFRAFISDADGDTLAFTYYGGPSHGYLAPNSDGTYTYYAPNWSGTESFNIIGNDGIVDSNPAQVSITVTNNAPIAVADEFYMHAGRVLSLDATSGLMHNDYDVDGDALTAEQVGPDPSNGTLGFNASGAFTFQANAGIVGDASFSYRLSDGMNYSDAVQVTIHVEDQAPHGAPKFFNVWTGNGMSAATENVLARDIGDPESPALTAVLNSSPTYASSFQLYPNGYFSYLPNQQQLNTADSFTYRAFDGTLFSAPINVSLNLTDAPVGVDDSYTVSSNGQLTVNLTNGVLADDFNPAGIPVIAEIVDAPTADVGQVNLNGDGSFAFTAGPNFQGEAEFTYRLLYQAGGAVLSARFPIVRIFADQVVQFGVGLVSVDFASNATIMSDTLNNFGLRQSFRFEEWRQARQYPVSVTRNTRLSLRPAFTFDANTLPYWLSLPAVRVRATSQPIIRADGASVQLHFGHATPIYMTVDDENAALTMSEFAAIDETLADFADYYPSMVLNWEISPNNGLTWFSPGNGSTSTNTVFVTLANPNQIGGGLMQNAEVPVLHTTLSAVADEVRGSTSVAALVTNAFFNFTLRNITRADGTAMTYWQSWDVAGIASRPDGLLQTADGNCVSWATFFVDVLRAWGADFSYAANVRQVVVDHQNSPVNATEFLVNNWAFGNQNVLVPPPPRLAGYSWYNEFGEPFAVNTVNGMRYNWQGQPAVTYLGGSAQNNPNPMADFSDHVFVRIGNVIYDPSYGVTYDPNLLNPTDDDLLRAFQTDAVAGYAWFPPVQGAIGAPRVYFRPTTIPNVPDVKLKFRNLF